MPVPFGYENATIEFRRLLHDARDAAGLVTTNQSFTMLEGVLRAFRRRLTVTDALAFADVLPAVARAVFVADWDVGEPRRAFGDRAAMTDEVKALRAGHNFSPDNCIEAVALALRHNVDTTVLDRVLAGLPPGAADFWAVPAPAREPAAGPAADGGPGRAALSARTDSPEAARMERARCPDHR